MIFSLYAGLLGLYFLFASVAVIRKRRAKQVAVGTGKDRELAAFVYAHENFQNYSPIFLILLAIGEFILGRWNLSGLVHLFGSLFIIGRILHWLGMTKYELQTPPNFNYRVSGMVLTFSCLFCLSLLAIIGSLTRAI